VILAVHSNQALALLEAPSHAERRILSAIRYQPNEAVLHRDEGVMPRSKRAWASWNYHIPRYDAERARVTYHMNRLQSLHEASDFFVTLNDDGSIDPAQVVERIAYDHPIFDAEALAAQRAHETIDGGGGVHYAGAYWSYGFHEDGLQSADRVCQRLESTP
jgi:predicted NAD/FAD-binding protein